MKKLFSKFMLVAVAALALTACEDVPEPYNLPGTGKNDPKGDIPEGTYLSETFSKDFGAFTCVTVKGTPWVIDYKTAKATGYDGSNTIESEAYLISPAIDLSLSENAYLEFDYILRYVRVGSTVNNVLITNDYTGDPSTTTWTNITGKLTEGSDWSTFTKYQRNLPAEFIGQKAVVIALYYSCASTSSTIEIKNLKLMEGVVEDEPITAETIGTAENPISTAEALTQINALSDGGKSTQKAYVKGKIVRIATNAENFAKYGNINYYISDDGTDNNTVQVYAGDGLNGEKFSSVNDIAAGDEVIVFGTLYKYVNKNSGAVVPEIEGSYLVSHVKGSGETPQPSGTEVTCAQAVELTNALADGGTSTETYTVTGYITEVVGSVSRNQQIFWMADTKDGGRVFEAYWANLPDGVSEFKAGMKVKITGNLMKYVKDGVVTPEIKNATVEILEAGGDTPHPSGTEVTCAQAVELTNALADGGTSTETYTVTGYITEVVGSVSRNQQIFWMADTKDGGRVFEAYWANLPDGVSEFKAGMKVKITGNLMKYVKDGVVTPEIKNADVEILEGGDPNPGGGEVSGTGSYSEPYSVAAVIANGTSNTVQGVYIKGYIVGWVDGQVLASGANFNGQATVKTNLLIADNATETDVAKCVPVQLPNNAVRTGLNLQDNPKYYGKQVMLYGNLEKYFGAAGVKGVTYAECDGDTMGSKP